MTRQTNANLGSPSWRSSNSDLATEQPNPLVHPKQLRRSRLACGTQQSRETPSCPLLSTKSAIFHELQTVRRSRGLASISAIKPARRACCVTYHSSVATKPKLSSWEGRKSSDRALTFWRRVSKRFKLSWRNGPGGVGKFCSICRLILRAASAWPTSSCNSRAIRRRSASCVSRSWRESVCRVSSARLRSVRSQLIP